MITKDDLRYWDNEKHSMVDRYTAVWPDGGYVGMSAHPFHPQGVGQHGEGAEYRPTCIKRNKDLWSYLGKMIEFEDLPTDCQELVLQDLEMDNVINSIDD